MNSIIGEFRIGEDIAVALDATSGDTATVTGISALMKPALVSANRLVFDDNASPVAMTVAAQSPASAGWTISLDNTQSALLSPGIYGIYTVNATGAPTRATDADGGTELAPGTAVSVTAGTTNGDKVFMITSDAAITVHTTAQTWGQLAGGTSYTAGNGINIASNVISAVAGNGIVVDGTGIRVDTSITARKFSANIGNGALTSIAVTHSLGTKDVTVAIRANADDSHVLADVVSTDTNTVTITFATAPASNAYRVTVVG